MTDAWDYLRQAALASQKGQAANRQYELLERAGVLPVPDDPAFHCFAALRAKEPLDFAAQRPPDPADFPGVCKKLIDEDQNLIALYRATRDLREYTQTAGWDPDKEGDRFFELLGKHKYRFRDIKVGGRAATAEEAPVAVRNRLHKLVHLLARAQPGLLARNAVSVAGKAALNMVRYRSPPTALEVSASINGAGIGAAFIASTAAGWRAEIGGSIEPWRVRQLDLTPGHGSDWTMETAADLLVGKEWAPSGRWQFSLAAGGDIRSITRNYDVFPYVVPEQELMWRIGPTLRLCATFYQRLTLGLAATFWPDHCAGDNTCSRAADGASQFAPVVSERGRLSLFLGWRFLDLDARLDELGSPRRREAAGVEVTGGRAARVVVEVAQPVHSSM